MLPPESGKSSRDLSFRLEEGGYAICAGAERIAQDIPQADVLRHLAEHAVGALATEARSAAFHAGAVLGNERAILIPGASGTGKTSITAWLVDQGFAFLSDELALAADRAGDILAFPRAMIFKAGRHDRLLANLKTLAAAPALASGGCTLLRPAAAQCAPLRPYPCGLMIFPQHEAGRPLSLAPLSAAQAALRLMAYNHSSEENAPDRGFAAVTALSRQAPAFALHYGDYAQLAGVLDELVRWVLEGRLDAGQIRRVVSAFGASAAVASAHPARRPTEIPAPTPRRVAPKLTIGMATYDDYDGVYFSLQALRLYHPEIVGDAEFLVIDNHPDGPCAFALKHLEDYVPNYRYVPYTARRSTTVKGQVFEEASGEFVLCIDCHVFVVPGALKRLLNYFERNPGTRDLLQGPMLHDDLKRISTHFEPKWCGGMYGHWADNGKADDPDAEPFEIPMQGTGLFACRKEAWLGFNPAFRGFGGEEGYIHEKFRQAGARTLCLPFLRWMHRFNRPMGATYPNRIADRIWNYTVGFRELGLPTDGIRTHFVELIGEQETAAALDSISEALDDLYPTHDEPSHPQQIARASAARRQAFETIFWTNGWQCAESVSGPGSTIATTLRFREEFERLLRDLKVRSLLDAPCGDFNWLSHFDLDIDRYIGIDIVPTLISANRKRFGTPNRTFVHGDIVCQDLPAADLILCRDCLGHLSNAEAVAALQNFRRTGSRWLLATSFDECRANCDIAAGGWRPVNLEAPPFNLPPPVRVIDERLEECGPDYRDKCLGLWRIDDLPA
ncbi:MAG: methyltransferase domain-containing protein [Variibacter sp.]